MLGTLGMQKWGFGMPDYQDRIDELKRKLRARQGKREYRDNVPALEAEIARLEALQKVAE